MTDTPTSQQQRREAEVVSRHLPEGYSAEPDVVSDDRGTATASAPDLLESGQVSSLKLQGGDIHRDLFKIDARAKLRQQRQHRRFHSVTIPVTKNFVEFLDLYGSFAGEDLAESEDEDEESQHAHVPSDTRPLLGHRKSSRRAKKQGDASTTKSFFTLLKAFIGTGIMFLPKAFNNGGILFSSVTLVTVSLVSFICFHLLLQCRKRYGGGYGDLGEAIGGPKLRSLILSSIAISQIGFVCAGVVFTAENLLSFVKAVSPDSKHLSTGVLIAMQLV